jgi:6-phosphogluconolactonase
VTEPTIIICRDANDLAQQAAAQFVSLAAAAIQSRGCFTVALSGGSTPKTLYSLLATPEFRERIVWNRAHLFWGDERCVPPDHPESNYRMVHEALLSKIEIPPENVHRMAGEKDSDSAAADYEQELSDFFRTTDPASGFDLVLLGLGEDGHTASLFPGSTALKETTRWVATAYVERLHTHRLTLTLPVINAAAQVSFLIAGESKSAIVKALLGKDSNPARYPAGLVRPVSGELTWFVTQDAATGLTSLGPGLRSLP